MTTGAVESTHNTVSEAGTGLEAIISGLDLQLRDTLNGLFPVSTMTAQYYDRTHKGLNDIIADGTSIDGKISLSLGIIKTGEKKIDDLTTDIAENEKQRASKNNTARAKGTSSADRITLQTEMTALQTSISADKKMLKVETKKLESERKKLEKLKNRKELIQKFTGGGIYENETTERRREFSEINSIASSFDNTSRISHQTVAIGGTSAPVPLTPIFARPTPPTFGPSLQYHMVGKDGKALMSGQDLVVTATDIAGNQQEITLNGVRLNNITKELSFANVSVGGRGTLQYPLQIQKLPIRGMYQDTTSGRMLYHDKNVTLTINSNNLNREDLFDAVETNLTPTVIQEKLDYQFRSHFDTIQSEAFLEAIKNNKTFQEMNLTDETKQELYSHMLELGTINGDATELAFGTHTRTIGTMNSLAAINYDEFKAFIIQQKTPPVEAMESESAYRSWLKNNLTEHMQDYFKEVLKQHTNNPDLTTMLVQAVENFERHSRGETVHTDFANELATTLADTTPNTYRKAQESGRESVKLFFSLGRNSPQESYLDFFAGQQQEFSGENITIGSETHKYAGNLKVDGTKSMTMSFTINGEKEKTMVGGDPRALMHAILTNSSIEPPQIRSHLAMNVVKNMTKMGQENGIPVRRKIDTDAPEFEALPFAKQNEFLALGDDNLFVETKEVDGKLVAEIYHEDFDTHRQHPKARFFDEGKFASTQNIRTLQRSAEGLLVVANHNFNAVYDEFRSARRRSRDSLMLRKPLMSKHKYGGLRNMWKRLSFEGETVSMGGKSYSLSCQSGLFKIEGGDLKKPLQSRNLGKLMKYKPQFYGLQIQLIRKANEKLIDMYQEKLENKYKVTDRHNFGVYDTEYQEMIIRDKFGNLGIVKRESAVGFNKRFYEEMMDGSDQFGRISDDNMPSGFEVIRKADGTVTDPTKYNRFLAQPQLCGQLIKEMARTHRGWFRRS